MLARPFAEQEPLRVHPTCREITANISQRVRPNICNKLGLHNTTVVPLLSTGPQSKQIEGVFAFLGKTHSKRVHHRSLENFSGLTEKLSRPVVDTKTL